MLSIEKIFLEELACGKVKPFIDVFQNMRHKWFADAYAGLNLSLTLIMYSGPVK